jgi:HD-GYP domain-containing protein (c-di-GMP phosphodiesterase class II)
VTEQKPKRRTGILVSILALLFVVGLVPLLWTSYTLVSRSSEILEADQRQIQHDKVIALSNHVENFIGAQRRQILSIARGLALGSAPGRVRARIEAIGADSALEQFVDGGTLLYLAVIDSAGAGSRSGVELPEFQDQVQLAWQRGLEGERTQGRPTFAASSAEPAIVFGEPILSSGGVSGVVVAVVSLTPLWSFMGELAEQGVYDVYLVDAEGKLIAHSNPGRLAVPSLAGVEIVEKFLVAGEYGFETMPFELETESGPAQMLGTYKRVGGGLDWGVIVQIEAALAYVAVQEMTRSSILLVAGVSILALALGWIFAGEITRPIRDLVRGARRLAAGNYETRVPTDARNEVGLLAESFNVMGEEIQKAIEEVRRQSNRNKELFMGSIRMLANAIDEKDPYTRGHSERVAYYSAMIAKHMGMPEDEVERVHLSGIIHDVGKIGIEDKILRKAAALTDDEYEIMKQHPTKGAHILEAVPMLKDMAGAGLQHHENVDGSGYPDGLKGDEIPLLGRIVSVADAFDAMTTERPYSKAMTYEAALARLRMLIGKKFDGPCVVAMEKAMADGDLTPGKATRAAVVARRQAVAS